MFKLSDAITVAETGFLHLKNPRDEEPITTGDDNAAVGITLHAPGSQAYVAADNRKTNRQLLRSKRGKKVTAEDIRADQHRFFADLTVSFDNLDVDGNGATGTDLFLATYEDPKNGWLTDQVNAFLNDWGNFTTTSPKS